MLCGISTQPTHTPSAAVPSRPPSVASMDDALMVASVVKHTGPLFSIVIEIEGTASPATHLWGDRRRHIARHEGALRTSTCIMSATARASILNRVVPTTSVQRGTTHTPTPCCARTASHVADARRRHTPRRHSSEEHTAHNTETHIERTCGGSGSVACACVIGTCATQRRQRTALRR